MTTNEGPRAQSIRKAEEQLANAEALLSEMKSFTSVPAYAIEEQEELVIRYRAALTTLKAHRIGGV